MLSRKFHFKSAPHSIKAYFLFALASFLMLGMAMPINAGNFPMVGQTWVFVNGPNEDTHIVRSLSEFAPSSAIMARFNGDGTFDMRYSNLSGRFQKSTTEALDSIEIDFRRNVIQNSNAFQATYQPIPDTAFSCDEELAKLSGTLRYSHYLMNGEETTPSLDSRNWHWFYEVPDCYACRPARQQDRQEKNLCQNHWCSDPTDEETSTVQEVCDDAYTECRQIIEEPSMKSRPSTRFFWNLHLFPKIILHPRHPATGRIMKEIPLSEEQAVTLRKQAIGSPGNEELKPYLNPAMDDSASVYFSGQFLWTDENADGVWSIRMEVSAEGEGSTGFFHDPPGAYRISSFDDWLGLQKALLLPFSRDDAEREFLSALDTRCPGWAFMDRLIGQKAFSVQEDLEVTLPDVLPAEPSDPAWTRVRQERVEVNGGVEVRTVVAEDRTLTGQSALVRNINFPYGDYFWKGCPDLEDGTFHRTKSQLARILSWPVPTCNLSTLTQAPGLYRNIGMRFKGLEDAEEKALAEQRAKEAEFQYERTRQKERPADLTCPDTPLDLLLKRGVAP